MDNRLTKATSLLQKNHLDAMLVSSIPNITYLTNYSGFSSIEREAYLLITKNNSYILTDGRYTEAVRDVVGFTLLEISSTKPLKDLLLELATKHKIKRLGIEENNLTVSEYKMLKKHFNDLNHFSDIAMLRAVKDSDEMKTIEEACKLGDKTFSHVLKKIKAGITEKELAFEIEFFIKKAEADISFKPIVAFGKNAAIPHHQTSNQRLASSGQFVLLDFGVKIDNYCSDMTRTVFFGKATEEEKKMYQTVLEAQTKAIQQLSNKTIKASDVDKIARNHITSYGYPTIPHSIGHGIGLEVHETPSLSPKSKAILQLGMVFSVEPGIYLPESGGVRIEDLVTLTPLGTEILTNAPKSFMEI